MRDATGSWRQRAGDWLGAILAGNGSLLTGAGRLVEVQGTAEGATFDRGQLDQMLDLAAKGIAELTAIQGKALSP